MPQDRTLKGIIGLGIFSRAWQLPFLDPSDNVLDVHGGMDHHRGAVPNASDNDAMKALQRGL